MKADFKETAQNAKASSLVSLANASQSERRNTPQEYMISYNQ